MNTQNIIAEIDTEIARLEEAKRLLSNIGTPKKGPGRPPKNIAPAAAAKTKKRKPLSAAGRANIIAAQRARWAKAKKAAKTA